VTNISFAKTQIGETDTAVFAIWTRALDNQTMAGRLRTALNIREAMRSAGRYHGEIMPSILSPTMGLKWIEAFRVFTSGLLAGRPLPLQCILFSAPRDIDDMCRRIPHEGIIYVDGIRLFKLAERLRAERPHQRVVIDLDDLQSRRIELLLNDRLPLSPGYLTEKLPPFFKLLISSLSRWILLYEHATLRRTEIEALGVADAVVLVSTEDGGILRKAVDPTLAARIQTIQPSFASPVIDPRPFDRVRRFIFVGTDGLTQNRLTIDYLIGLWRERRPATPLVIFGKQSRNTSLPEGVTAAGYVESLSEIYDDQSVLLTPSFIRGGIKTKVLEAFAHRVPVVGNDCTFEAMDFPDYPFSLDSEESLLELIENPDNFTSAFRSAADQGFARVRENYSPKVFAERWRAALGLPSKEVEVAH
jgi:glycosyltransferase involved in cell wall biosynthesis